MRRANLNNVARRILATTLSLSMVFGTNIMTLADDAIVESSTEKAADETTNENWLDLSNGLQAGTTYEGGIIVDETWGLKPVSTEEAVTVVSADGVEVTLGNYMVQGTTNGTTMTIVPEKDETITFVYKIGNNKIYYFNSTDDADVNWEYKNTSGDSEYALKTFELKAGCTYKLTGSGTKPMIYGIKIEYVEEVVDNGEWLDLSNGLLLGETYLGGIIVDETWGLKPVSTEEAVTVVSADGVEVTLGNYMVQGTTNGTTMTIVPEKDETITFVYKIGNNKIYYFNSTDDTDVNWEYKNTSGDSEYALKTFELKAGCTYKLTGSGTKPMIYGIKIEFANVEDDDNNNNNTASEVKIVNMDGNLAEVSGSTIRLGKAAKNACGVEIVNPLSGNEELTTEKLADALANSTEAANYFVWARPTSNDATDEKNTVAAGAAYVYYVAPFTSVAEAKAYVEECSNVGAEIVTDAAALTFTVNSANKDQYVQNWDKTKGIKIMNLAQLIGTGDENAEVSLPYPVWKNGVTVSTWVKASTDQAAPIFVFQDQDEKYAKNNKFGGLALYTDGTVMFAQDDSGSSLGNGAKRNMYGVKFTNDNTPASKVGEWVYVTISIQNDGVEVYYNGEATTKSEIGNYTQGKTNVKYFNYSYGFDDGKLAGAERFTNSDVISWQAQRLTIWTPADVCTETAVDFESLYPYQDSNGEATVNIMEYLTAETTKLYIGGTTPNTDSNWYVSNTYGSNGYNYIGFEYTNATEGMFVSDFTVTENTVDDEESAKAIYDASVVPETFETEYVYDEFTSYEFGKNVVSTGDALLINDSAIVLGKANSVTASGVEIVNPLSGNEELTAEKLADALANSTEAANYFVWARPTNNDAKAEGNTLAGGGAYAYYVAPFTSVAEAKKYVETVTGAAIVTDASLLEFPINPSNTDQYIQNFDPTKAVKLINLAQLVGTGDENTEVSLPYPIWNTAVTVSTWVKASTDQATPIFVFQDQDEKYAKNNKFGGLALYTDGTVMFAQDDSSSSLGNGAKRNMYGAQFTNEYTPASNVGEWVYVTMIIKNDNIEVYYNGEVAAKTMLGNYKQGKSNTKYFNGSYGFDDGTGVKRFSNSSDLLGWQAQRLVGWESTITSEAATSFEDLLPAVDSSGDVSVSIMEYLTAETTKLYIGGTIPNTDSNWYVSNTYGSNNYSGFEYTDAGKGMMVSDFAYSLTQPDAKQVIAMYYDAAKPEVFDSSYKYTDLTGYEFNDKNIVSSGDAVLVTDSAIVLGYATSGAACGVEIVNPLSGNEKLTAEKLADALANSTEAANYFVWARPTNNDAKAEGNTLAGGGAYAYYVAPFTSVAEAKKYVETVTGAAIVTDASLLEFPINPSNTDQYIQNFDPTKAVKLINLAQLVGTGDENTEVSLPYPIWNTAVTVSTWVKASTDQATPIFVFQDQDEKYAANNKFGGLALYTDGTVMFAQDDSSSNLGNGAKRNMYGAQFTNEYTPASNVGEWVYVTISIKNDGVEVYYNGKAATKTMLGSYAQGKSNTKYFNGSYGFDDGTGAERFSNSSDLLGWQAQRLVGWEPATITSEAATSFEDLLPAVDSAGDVSVSIMEYLTAATTKLYIGGTTPNTDSNWYVSNTYGSNGYNYIGFEYTNAGKAMIVSDFAYSLTKTDEKQAMNMYLNAVEPKIEAPEIIEPEEPTPTTGPATEVPPTNTPDGSETTGPATEVPPTNTPDGSETTGPATEVPPTTPSQTPEVEKTVGDANGDGYVKLDDVMIILRAALGIEGLEEGSQAFINADVNNDKTIGLDDCLAVLKMALGIKED